MEPWRRLDLASADEARRLLREHRVQLDAIVTELLARESLDEAEIYAAAGIVRATHDGEPDGPIGQWRFLRAMGNYLVLEVAPATPWDRASAAVEDGRFQKVVLDSTVRPAGL